MGLDREAVAAVCRALGDLGASEKLMFWLRDHGALAGKSVAAALEAGAGLAKVERLAAAWARRGRTSEEPRVAPEVLLRLPEPESFEDLLRPARLEVASLVRLSRHPATEPYGSTGVYRFDDPVSGPSGRSADHFIADMPTCRHAGLREVRRPHLPNPILFDPVAVALEPRHDAAHATRVPGQHDVGQQRVDAGDCRHLL